MARKELPVSMLTQMLRCDAESGKLYWLRREVSSFSETHNRTAAHCCANWNSKFAGKEAAASLGRQGYLRTRIAGIGYQSHRIVWAIATGEWPKGQIDHINGIRSDNRILNLRDVTPLENHRNVATRRNTATGVMGVTELPSGRYRSLIKTPSGRKHLGCFATIEEALAVRKRAEKDLGYHPNHGRPPLTTEGTSANG